MSETVASTQDESATGGGAPWRLQVALVLIISAEFMLQLDTTIMNVALPSIETDLGFSFAGLSWVTNAFLLAFGGLLLLGGRLGDIVGHRRIFLIGIAVFTLASLTGGLAVNDTMLVLSRAVQGIGAALSAPTGLALLAITFRSEALRNRAFAIYSTISGTGLALGLVLGGVLTASLSWRWVLLINVPVGLVVIALVPRFVATSDRQRGTFDLAGAALSVVSTTLFVYSLIEASESGWRTPTAIGGLAVAAVLLAALLIVESRVSQPILPLRLFTGRTRSFAYLNLLLVAATLTSMWFFLTQFLQGPLRLSPFETGLAFLPMAALVFAASQVVPKLLTRLQPRTIAISGLVVLTAAMVWLTTVSPGSTYVGVVLGPLILIGIAAGLIMVSHNLIVIGATPTEETGAAAGVLQAMLTVGGSIGLAVLVAVFEGAGGTGAPGSSALVASLSTTFAIAAGLALVGLLVAVFLLRNPAKADS